MTRHKSVWHSTCKGCSMSLVNEGSGRGRSRCDACRRQQMREFSNKRYQRTKTLTPKPKHKTREQEIREYIQAVKIGIGQCQDGLFCNPDLRCTEEFATLFAFDHRVLSTKLFTLSNPTKPLRNRPRLKYSEITDKVIDDEIAKCDLVCHNCHAYRSHKGKHHRMQSVFTIIKKAVTQLSLWDAA